MLTLPDKITGYRSRVINALIDYLKTEHVVPSAEVLPVRTTAGTKLRLAPQGRHPGFPWGVDWSFGLAISGAVVTVYPGTIEYGNTSQTTIATDITIKGDGQYIALELDRQAGTATITGPHNSRPAPSGETFRTALYVFNLTTAAQAVLVRCCLSDIRMGAIV